MTMRIASIGIGVLAVTAVFAQPPQPARAGRGGLGGFLGAQVLVPGQVVKNAPFSGDIVTQTTVTLTDGNHIKQSSTVHVYRDSEGRTRREVTPGLNGSAAGTSGAAARQMVFINDPVAQETYALDPANRTATRTTHAPRPAALPRPQFEVQPRVNRQ